MEFEMRYEEEVEKILQMWCDYGAVDAINIVNKLVSLGYFDAPASTKYHGSYPGGLAIHSMEVRNNLYMLTDRMLLPWRERRSPHIIGLFHDLCKCDQYIMGEDGRFTYNKDTKLKGHGDKSIILIEEELGIKLTEEEKLCIRWHMGAFDEKENWSLYTEAIHKYPTVLWTHTADMMATHIAMK